ncbi:MAG: hypothetical protein IPM92_04320 [Saprospiraceae bacterium]|nr:hypothetical protein [Saprospiraceae bacterium]
MKQANEPIETLKEIRSLMERSSRFLSLSGLSGVIAGMAALAGIAAIYSFLGLSFDEAGYHRFLNVESNPNAYYFIGIILLTVLLVSIAAATWLTIRKANQDGQSIWDPTAKRLLLNLCIPLIVGGVYCIILLYHQQIKFIMPLTLIFYGLALINASKYTMAHIRYLGFVQICIGLLASLFLEYGLLFWALGFGLVHITYGIISYYKYEA